MAEKKRRGYCGISLLLLAAMCISLLGFASVRAAALPKPSFSVTKRAKKTATIKIKKKGNVTGFQIFMANSKKGKYKQVDVVRKKYTYTFQKLKENQAYYVKLRAYRTTKNYRISYGKYSSAVQIPKYKAPAKPTPKPTPTPVPTETPVPEETPTASSIPEETQTASPIPEGTPMVSPVP